jgi:hypothetical protein
MLVFNNEKTKNLVDRDNLICVDFPRTLIMVVNLSTPEIVLC